MEVDGSYLKSCDCKEVCVHVMFKPSTSVCIHSAPTLNILLHLVFEDLQVDVVTNACVCVVGVCVCVCCCVLWFCVVFFVCVCVCVRENMGLRLGWLIRGDLIITVA